ncbi:hypothetical protein LXL04_015064 [Taraxacum kok-saghyz]
MNVPAFSRFLGFKHHSKPHTSGKLCPKYRLPGLRIINRLNQKLDDPSHKDPISTQFLPKLDKKPSFFTRRNRETPPVEVKTKEISQKQKEPFTFLRKHRKKTKKRKESNVYFREQTQRNLKYNPNGHRACLKNAQPRNINPAKSYVGLSCNQNNKSKKERKKRKEKKRKGCFFVYQSTPTKAYRSALKQKGGKKRECMLQSEPAVTHFGFGEKTRWKGCKMSSTHGLDSLKDLLSNRQMSYGVQTCEKRHLKGKNYLGLNKPSDHGQLRDGETQTRASHRIFHDPKDYPALGVSSCSVFTSVEHMPFLFINY